MVTRAPSGADSTFRVAPEIAHPLSDGEETEAPFGWEPDVSKPRPLSHPEPTFQLPVSGKSDSLGLGMLDHVGEQLLTTRKRVIFLRASREAGGGSRSASP
jgi:hypothetical protein